MNKYDVYDVSVNEIHHTAKLDAPSGTAISIANEIISELDRKIDWSLGKSEKSNVLMINSERIDPTPGTHNVVYDSDIDSIEIIHTAKNRKGFATGAVIAAEWLKDKNGFYEFKEVFFKH
jgi:4-hydroxy-tetrahydrodipicolinate reductase